MAEEKKNIQAATPTEPKAEVKKAPSGPPKPEEFFDELPTQEPIIVAVGSEAGIGKTHFANTFPNPVLGDTEDRAQIVMKKLGTKWRKSTKNMLTIRQTLSMMETQLCPKREDRINWTYVLDSASDFTQFAETEYLTEAQKEKVYPLVLWAKVYNKMDDVFDKIRALGINGVFTQQVKEIYRNEKATGEYELSGYKKIPYRVDVRIHLKKGVEYEGHIYYEDVVVGEVLKDSWHKPEERKPYLVDVSYDGIFKEIKPYVHPGSKKAAIEQVLKELEAKTGVKIADAKSVKK